MKISVGQKAPDFSLPDQAGEKHQLSQYRSNWVLLYFYPRDNTPGCTKEACAIRDVWADFRKANIKVLGLSGDSVESHRQFVDKFDLPFTLLADENKSIIKSYGVLKEKKNFGKVYLGMVRTSFLIDPEGKIAKIYPSVKPEEHATEVLADVKQLST